MPAPAVGLRRSVCKSVSSRLYLVNEWTYSDETSHFLTTRSTWHWWHFQGNGFKGQSHAAMAIEILWTRWLLNHWRDLNQTLAH